MIAKSKVKLLRKKPWSPIEDRVSLPVPRGFDSFSFDEGTEISLGDFISNSVRYNVLHISLPISGTKGYSYDFVLENWSLQL